MHEAMLRIFWIASLIITESIGQSNLISADAAVIKEAPARHSPNTSSTTATFEDDSIFLDCSNMKIQFMSMSGRWPPTDPKPTDSRTYVFSQIRQTVFIFDSQGLTAQGQCNGIKCEYMSVSRESVNWSGKDDYYKVNGEINRITGNFNQTAESKDDFQRVTGKCERVADPRIGSRPKF
jgi:hypothetical protein